MLLNKKLHTNTLECLRDTQNSHFMFNVLNMLQGFILTENRDASFSLFQHYASFTRILLNSANHFETELALEWKLAHLYLSLEKKRFDDKVDFNWPELEWKQQQIPSFLLLFFLENEWQKHRTLELEIFEPSCHVTESTVALTLDYKDAKTDKIQSKLQAKMDLFFERIDLLNEQNPERVQVEISGEDCNQSTLSITFKN